MTHNERAMAYLQSQEGLRVSNQMVADAIGVSRVHVARVLYYLHRKHESIHKVKKGVWILNPTGEVKTEKPKLIQLANLFQEKGTVSASEIGDKLNLNSKDVVKLVARFKGELNADVSREIHYTFNDWYR